MSPGRMEIMESTAPTKTSSSWISASHSKDTTPRLYSGLPGRKRPRSPGDGRPTTFITKVMSVFFDLDKMIGTDFAVGLANLKRLTEQN